MTTSFNNNVSDKEAQHSCFEEWMELQQQDLLELIHNSDSSSSSSTSNTSASSDFNLKQLIEKSIKHFQEYIDTRRHLACSDVTAYLAPTWCTTLESSMLWISGCRPSSYIRLLYAMSGKEFESHLSNYLQGNRSGHLSGLLTVQLNSVDELQRKTIRQEDQLSNKLASLQEEIADQPFAIIANEVGNPGEICREAEEALDRHAKFLVNVVEEADKLRMVTLKELINILSPLQAVDFLIASKKLHLCVNAWGKKRDHQHGRNRETKQERNTCPTLSGLKN
ncbi:protein DOG1-like 3 [Solanum lycopersicum]|uniref:DOG1 domain-containing protein n=1 Tax=Solanum lycopersicum TaxID=4081 RepID=A0A3Q7F3I2_SOLLC|nr:protein DOG1-like 3 [Solanum lycopersicum]